MSKQSRKNKIVSLTLALILGVTSVIWLLAPHSAEAAEAYVRTDAENFRLHSRCARLAEIAKLRMVFAEHVRTAKFYAAKIGDDGSIPYEVGYIDGAVAQIVRATQGKYTPSGVADILYKSTCPAQA